MHQHETCPALGLRSDSGVQASQFTVSCQYESLMIATPDQACSICSDAGATSQEQPRAKEDKKS